jgi:hypothetical protein
MRWEWSIPNARTRWWRPYEQLVSLVRERFPAMRIVTDRDTPGASAVATSPDDVREALRSLARPGGPILEDP